MRIVIKDRQSGKEYLIKGNRLDFEIFKRSKGKQKDGKLVGEGEWTTCRRYPSSLKGAVEQCVNFILADPDDDDEVVVEAVEAGKQVAAAVKRRVAKIIVEVVESDATD